MLYSVIMLLIFLILIPYLIGMLLQKYTNYSTNSIAYAFVLGFSVIFALFQIIAIVFVYFYPIFYTIVILMSVILLALSILSIFLNNKAIYSSLINLTKYIKKMPMIFWSAILLIVIQTFIATVFMHSDADDSFYVTSVNDIVNPNNNAIVYRVNAYSGISDTHFSQRYFNSMYEVCIAFFCKITNIHPAIFMHTIMPAMLIPFSYSVYYLIGKELFKNDTKKISLMLMFVCIITIFGNQSGYTQFSFLLFRIWQGKAILAAIIIPIVFLLAINAFSKNGNFADYLALTMAMTAACCVTSLGIVVTLIALWSMAIAFAILKKKVIFLAYSLICSLPNLIFGTISIV